MSKIDLQNRTKQFSLRILKLSKAIPNTREGNAIANQIIRSGTSVAANYRATCRAKSKADFISKLSIVEEETDESLFWMEIIIESGILEKQLLSHLMKEANEILAIVVKSKITARKNS